MDDRLDLDIQQRDAVEAHSRDAHSRTNVGRPAQTRNRVARAGEEGAGAAAARFPGERRFVVRLPAERQRAILRQYRDRRPAHATRQPAAACSQLRSLRPGDDSVLTYENQQKIIDAVTDPTQWLNGAPDGILVSMGGDDLVGDQFAIYLDYDGSGLDPTCFQGALGSVRASDPDLFALRDAVLPGTPVIGHCYDYAIPNGVPALCAGPWLQPSLEFSGYDLAEGLAIVSSMIDGFYAMVSALAGDAGNNFVLVDTRGTLKRVSGASDGWANEVHPYPAGFSAIGAKISRRCRGFPRRRSQLRPLDAARRNDGSSASFVQRNWICLCDNQKSRSETSAHLEPGADAGGAMFRDR